VYYTTIAELAFATRMYERGIDSVFSFADRLGSGYIIIGDLCESGHDRSPTEWRDLQMILLSHLSRGGGLVIGLPTEKTHFLGLDFSEAMGVFSTVFVE
jgi:hypothetical protein